MICPLVWGRRGAALGLLWMAASAWGQVSASLAAESDYRWRGVSLSNARPDLHLNLAYDHSSGWYAGASIGAVEFDSPPRQVALLGYFGYARRVAPGLACEIGLSAAHFGVNSPNDYAEVLIGLIREHWNLRAYFSPSYLGSGTRTVYAELNGGWPLSLLSSELGHRPVRLVSHVGALTRLDGGTSEDSHRVRFDARLGLSVNLEDSEFQLAWVGGGSNDFYPLEYGRRRNAWVLSAAYFF